MLPYPYTCAQVTDDGRWLVLYISEGCRPANRVYLADLQGLAKTEGGAPDFKAYDFSKGARALRCSPRRACRCGLLEEALRGACCPLSRAFAPGAGSVRCAPVPCLPRLPTHVFAPPPLPPYSLPPHH